MQGAKFHFKKLVPYKDCLNSCCAAMDRHARWVCSRSA